MMDMKRTESGLYVPKSLNKLNMVKGDPRERLRRYLRGLIEADKQIGKIRAVALYKLVGELITKSFSKVILPAHIQPTTNMVNERMGICAEIVLRLADQGWTSTRIYDELERIFFKELIEGKQETSERSSWGVEEKRPVDLEITKDLIK